MDSITEQSKQELSRGNRRARTSAAMIGLALSMGASGALIPRHDDRAVAAEAKSAESAIAALPLDSRALIVTAPSTAASVEIPTLVSQTSHTVREGQTLWQIAQEHRVHVEDLAASNHMVPNDVLQVGQVLTVPNSKTTPPTYSAISAQPQSIEPETASAFPSTDPEAVRLATQRGIGGLLPEFEQSDNRLKTEQDESLARLRQKQQMLNERLTALRAGGTATASPLAKADQPPVAMTKLAKPDESKAAKPGSDDTTKPTAAEVMTTAPRTATSLLGSESAIAQPEVENGVAPSEPRQAAVLVPTVPTAVAPAVAPEAEVPMAAATVTPNAVVPEAVVPALESETTSTPVSGEVRQAEQVAVAETAPTLTVPEATSASEPEALEQPTTLSNLPQNQVQPAPPAAVAVATTPTIGQPQAIAPSADRLPSVLQSSASIGESGENQPFSTVPPLRSVESPQLLASADESDQSSSPSASAVALNNVRVPVIEPESSAPQSSAYQIKAGDTLTAIARQHGISRDELARANNIRNPNMIWAGTTLTIPQARSAASNPPSIANLPTQPVTVAANRLTPGSLSQAPGQVVVPTSNSLQVSTPAEDIPTVLPNANAEPFSSPLMSSPEETQIAAAPLAARSGSTEANSVSGSQPEMNPYVAGLLEEIRTMRANRQAEAGQVEAIQPATTETQVAVATLNGEGGTTMPSLYLSPTAIPGITPEAPASDVSTPVEVAPEPETETPRAPVSVSRPSQQLAEEPQLMAAAPLGSESYAPLAQPLTSRVVSPDLPALPEAGEYLPESIPSSNGFIWPAQGVFTSGYGWRWGRMHRGIDVAAPVGTPVVAAASGVVISAGWNSGGYGNLVEIRHPDGTLTRYAHNNRLLVHSGQSVKQGEQIAEMGSTGYSTGPHVHFEIHPPEQGAVNPMAFLPNR